MNVINYGGYYATVLLRNFVFDSCNILITKLDLILCKMSIQSKISVTGVKIVFLRYDI